MAADAGFKTMVSLMAGLALAWGGFATGQRVAVIPSTPFIALSIATHLCSINEGVKEIQRTGAERYQMVCRNGAHFPDVTIRVKPEINPTEGERK